MKFSIKFSDFRNEPEAVFILEIRCDCLINAGILADESWKESRAAGRFGERAHDIVCLKKCNLVQARKPRLEIQPSQLSHGNRVDHRVGRLGFFESFPVRMFADVGVEAGAQEEDRFLAVNPVEPLKRVVDRIVQARFAIGRDSHPPQAIE